MRGRKLLYLFCLSVLLTSFPSCDNPSKTLSPTDEAAPDDGSSDYTTPVVFSGAISDALAANQDDHEKDDDYTWDPDQSVGITLNRNSATVTGNGATAEGNIVTISAAGTYDVSGSLTDGRIVVQADADELVRLVLNGVEINCSTSAPITIKSAKKVILIVPDGTENTLTDGASYVYDNSAEEEPNAAVFSKADLSVTGGGSLTVNGRFNDGISSKDGLILRNCNLTVTAADDGIRGKDYLVIRGGTITVTASGDGLVSDNDEDASRGYILVEAGAITVNAGGDGIQAQTDALIAGGNWKLTTGKGANFTVSGDASAKAIKAKKNTIIDGGTFSISSADDAVHSDCGMTVNGGNFSITCSDDAFHADTVLVINDGGIDVTRCYEGLESRALTINGGTVRIVASDDGINAADGSANTGGGGGRPPGQGGGGGLPIGNFTLAINGGTLAVTSGGDGFDINGSITMTGGMVIVNGPTAQNNGALDYDTGFRMTGGFLVAAGSSGMAMAPGSNSTQYSLLLNVTSTLPAGTLFHIQDSEGQDVLTFSPAKQYQSVAFSSEKLKKGTAYSVFIGGSSSGTVTDGLYSGGSYKAGGAAYTTFTVSSVVTKVNAR
jgi:hypothetical protein